MLTVKSQQQDQVDTKRDPLMGKRLVMLGLARQGLALARFAVSQGAEVVVSDLRSAETLSKQIAELSDLDIEFVLGEHPESLLDGTDVVAISGSVPADAAFVSKARARDIEISNDSQEFLRRAPSATIGITGSAGKSTTTSLVGEMGKASGRTTWVGGNIGRPLIAEVNEMQAGDLIVQELSSFQLEIWQHSPHIAAILNITPNHLDRHKTMAVYADAKANILKRQTSSDIAILPADELTDLHAMAQGRLRLFSATQPVEDGAFVRDGVIILRDGSIEAEVCRIDEIQLRGKHNVLNVLAAVVLANSAEIPLTAMQDAIRNFTGIAHRLEIVANVGGVQYINDSIATAPERSIAAIQSYHEPLILLAGGRDKDLDWSDWARLVEDRVKTVVLFGELAPMVAAQFNAETVQVVQTATMAEAVKIASQEAQSGDVILLSPGGTSYDAYQDFAERGEHFRQLVNDLRD